MKVQDGDSSPYHKLEVTIAPEWTEKWFRMSHKEFSERYKREKAAGDSSKNLERKERMGDEITRARTLILQANVDGSDVEVLDMSPSLPYFLPYNDVKTFYKRVVANFAAQKKPMI